MELAEEQQRVLATDGHLIVTGGPGSGKTTSAILKAAQVIDKGLQPAQSVLFLSFARATVSRVVEAIEYEQELPTEYKKRVEVATYHSFFWRIIKTHGYLIGLPRRLDILLPPSEAIALSKIRNETGPESKLSPSDKADKQRREREELVRLAKEDGRVAFDLFAAFAGELIHRSRRVLELIGNRFPVIILDEFQDTNADQWNVVRALGKASRLIALADPEQRIYDWLGADPERLKHFCGAFEPTVIDLSGHNYRSHGTDILLFGNDILRGTFTKRKYTGIDVRVYTPQRDPAFTALVTNILRARTRLLGNGREDWSVAVLVPTKKMTRLVSDVLSDPPAGLKPVPHQAAVEMEGVILAAQVLAFLLQPDRDSSHLEQFVHLVRDYYLGRGGENPRRGDLTEAARIDAAYRAYKERLSDGKAIKGNSILVKTLATYERARALSLTGDPDADWRALRDILEKGQCGRLQRIAEEVRNLRLLNRGAQLRYKLAEEWRTNGAYVNALNAVQEAFAHEHFTTNLRPETGVIVMNMHKAKGKQFDEVVIFEGWPVVSKGEVLSNPDRIVISNSPQNDNDQARQNLRVSVTRARERTTILTPRSDPCILLRNRG